MLTFSKPKPKRHRAKQVGVVEGIDGTRLRIMRYKIPEPNYTSPQCTPSNVTHIDIEYLTMLLWQLAVDCGRWRRCLDVMDPGLVDEVEGEFSVDLNWQGFSGQRLQSLIAQEAAAGLLPIVMRAPFITTHEREAQFLEHWTDPDKRRTMARFARHVPESRANEKDEAALLHMLGTFGLELRPAAPEGASTAFVELASLLAKSSGLFPSPNQKKRKAPTPTDLEDRGCGCS